MPTIRFVDLWRNAGHSFGELVSLIPGARVVDSGNPDILVYSVFGDSHKGIGAGLRVAVNWESSESRPTPAADLKFTSSFEPGSTWAPLLLNNTRAVRDRLRRTASAAPAAFASAIFSHNTELRVNFMATLLSRCPDADIRVGGDNAFSNTSAIQRCGNWQDGKHEWLRDNKALFHICPENSFHPGYTTEKIRDAYLSGHIPVYWGCRDRLESYIPEGSYVWLDPDNIDGTIDLMLDIWNSPDRQAEMLARAPIGKLCERTAQEIMAEGILDAQPWGLLGRPRGS